MPWPPQPALLFWIATLGTSLVLSILTWRSTTSGQLIETPDGLGGRRSYSRLQLALMPPLILFVAGVVFFVVLGEGRSSGAAIYFSVWIVALVVAQAILIGIVRARRRDRRARRKELLGE